MARKQHHNEHPWRSPDHPPYALMIGEAIEALSDPAGATPTVISDYILSNFDGLPPAHLKLFPFYLRKLVDMEIIAELFPGRFVIADPEINEESTHIVQFHGERKPVAESRKRRPKINRDLDQKMSKRRGRPPKRGQKESQITPLLITPDRRGDLVKRGRGRPPKRDKKGIQMTPLFRISDRQGGLVKRDQGRFQMPPSMFIAAPPGDSVKRGRGRPLKKTEEKLQFPQQLEAMKLVEYKPADAPADRPRKKKCCVAGGCAGR